MTTASEGGGGRGGGGTGEGGAGGGEQPGKPLLVFPTDYPIKVVGRREAGLRERIDAVVLRHVPEILEEHIRERPSGQGNFISITYRIVAQSREQVIALVGDLTKTEGVLMVL
jgi:putative lipoic acid-binding regulatory protein